MATPTQFRHYLIAQDADGANLEVLRSSEQVAVFAFDSRRQVFVHCHVLLDPVEDHAAFESRARLFADKGHPLRARVVEYGEDDSSAFYITENVDGETLRAYLERREDLPARVAVKLAKAVLRAMEGLGPLGDSLPTRALESLRLVQAGPQSLVAVLADYCLVMAKDAAKAEPQALGQQIQFLQTWLGEHLRKSTEGDEATVRSAELQEQLTRVLSSWSLQGAALLSQAIADLERLDAAPQEGELSAALKPKPYLAPMMANFQELARSISQTVRIQSQKLTPAQPYALRGMYMKTGQTVVVEQLPPRRLAGNFPDVALRQVQNLPKGKYPNLIPVVFVEHGEEIECMGETAVEGVPLSDLLEVRRVLDPQEVYVVLASMDAALEQMEKAGVACHRLRLEDIYLFTGFGKEAPVDTGLLNTKLNEWPGFSIVIRTHPCMHGMAGRGTDPGLLLPLPGPTKGGASPVWNGGWMAALGCCLVGMPDGSASKHVTGIPQTDSVCALLEDELQRTAKGVPSPRASFLSRFAKLVQKYELVQPKPTVPHAELSGVEPAQGAAREMPKAGTALPARKGASPPPPMPQQQRPVAEEEQPALGFAEALIQKSSMEEVEDDFDEEFALPPMRSGMRLRSSTVESSWMSVRSKRPFWVTCTLVVAGALLVGAGLAHYTGRAVWLQGDKDKTSAPTPAPKADEKAATATRIDLPVAPDTGKSAKLSLPPPSKPVVKELEALAKHGGTSSPGSGAGASPAGAAVAKSAPPVEVAMAIPLASDPSLISKLQDLRKTGGKLTKELRGSAERAAQSGSSEAMLAMGRAYLRGEGGPADERSGFVWIEKASAAGDVAAYIPLAECYLQGWGTPPDGAKAASLLEKATAGGDVVAKDLLGVCYARGIGVERDDARAFQLCTDAYGAGVASACGNLGALYLRGQGTSPDAERAVQLFAEGAGRGHAESMMLYAQCLEYGTGVLTNRDEASRWYQQAAKQGNAAAAGWCRQKGVTF
ncbi:Sel1-like repeat-containing protein kinase family protein [Verrucomicrobium sp. BvORR034]|uniref:Sel1-like repeat-containing protein kinase family protein n=1 Tax=Verrucomicrobium sp. BvORR034 TaxID=1396418 RepID=UPI00067890F4|nr:Sel1-like repeat-containing protein kinase family protein [Verrucomicrobium sp. BvORR034]